MRAIITNSYYQKEPFLVHWIGRWENGEKMHYVFKPPFKPYFYHEDEYKNMVKEEVDLPSEVPAEREKYTQTWEADIVFPERVLIDMNIWKGVDIIDSTKTNTENNCYPSDYKGITLRKTYIDIETDDRVPIDLELPKGAVLSIALRDSYTNITLIYTTIPKEKINTIKLIEELRISNEEIRQSLIARGLHNLVKYVGNLDIKVVSFKTEKEMLEAYRDYLYSDNYGDINIGYNINGFDIPYLQQRAIEPMFDSYVNGRRKKINLGYKINKFGREYSATHSRIINFDMYQAYVRLQENDMETASLESVALKELGIGKVKHTEGYYEMYDKFPEKFLIYNYRDSLLVHLIDLKLGVFDFFLMLSNKAGTLNIGKWNSTYLIDTLLFRVTHGTPFKIPTHTTKTKVEVPGGKVIPASNGIFKNVIVFDYKHLYPRIIRQFNMSYETILFDDQIGENDVFIAEIQGRKVGFSGSKEGIMPKTIFQLEKERYEIKNRMKSYPSNSDMYSILNNEQRSVKELDNSFYGMTGSVYARLFDPYIQASITYIGRLAIAYVKEIISDIATVEALDYKVIYGDTDSVFIHCVNWETMSIEDIVKDAVRLNDVVNNTLVSFVKRFRKDPKEVIMEMEFEKLYRSWAQFGNMKQYAGYIIWKDGKVLTEPSLEVKGFDPRRSDRSLYTKNYLIPTLLKNVLEDREKALEFIGTEREKWLKHKIDINRIGIYFSLNKEEYANNYQQKRAVVNSKKLGIKLDRMKGKYRMYFLKGDMDVVAVNYDEPLPSSLKRKIDWDAHMRRCFTLRVDDIEKSIKDGYRECYEVEE